MPDRVAIMARGLIAVAVLLLLGSAEAETTYRFEDDTGTVHYTNVPTDARYQTAWTDPDPPATPSSVPTASRGLAALAAAIRSAAERYGVDGRLIEAVIRVESGGNPSAVSPKGALGLMQLMPQRAAELGVQNPFNPLQNLDGGVRHLRDLLLRFAGDVTLALAAYNAGEAAVRAHQGVPPFPETRDYVRKVRALYNAAAVLVVGGAVEMTPQQIYREVGDDGTLIFTNLPPRPAVTLQQKF